VVIEPKNRQILAVTISKERNMLIAGRFLLSLVKVHGKLFVFTNGGTSYSQGYEFLKLPIISIPQGRKALFRERFNTSRIEPNVSMITFPAG
jgi:transposase-like protein